MDRPSSANNDIGNRVLAEFPANLEAQTVATDFGEVILEPG